MKNRNFAVIAAALAAISTSHAFADDAVLKNRSIAYVMTADHWAMFATADGKVECPDGVNDGPREEYVKLFPKDDTKRTLVATSLEREGSIWFPSLTADPHPFKESKSKVVNGLNLDGKMGPNDYETPSGEKGIDNQFNRAVGCVDTFRPDNGNYLNLGLNLQRKAWGRMLIEITNVDSLANDDDVTVTWYKGLDPLLQDSTGSGFLPYGTQRIDTKRGGMFTARTHGKIVNGVLTTDPVDMLFTYNYYQQAYAKYTFRDARFKMNVLPDQANGLLGGYVDIESFYRAEIKTMSTFTLSFGREAPQAVYRALSKLADAHPDPETKRNTAISAAKELKFQRVYIQRDEKRVAQAQ